MADIDYEAIQNAIKAVLDKELPATYPNGVKVEVDPPEVGLSNDPEIGIYLASEDPNEVEIGGDAPYETTLAFSLLCGVTGETMPEACKKRNELVNAVKKALQTDRDLGGKVDSSARGKIEFDSLDKAGFWAAATITLNAKLMA